MAGIPRYSYWYDVIVTGKQRSADVLIRIFEKNQLRPFTANILTDFALILCIITFWRNVFMKL